MPEFYQWEFHLLCLGAFLFGTGGFVTSLWALKKSNDTEERQTLNELEG